MGMVKMATLPSAASAHIVAARLSSEVIDCRLTGGVDNPYKFTIGEMAQVELWVHPDDVEDARTVLLVAEVDDTLGGRLSDERAPTHRPAIWFAAAAILVVIVLMAVLRYL